jgi:hypothetical protein
MLQDLARRSDNQTIRHSSADAAAFEEVSAMDRQWDVSPDLIVSSISSTRRVEKKGRKWGTLEDTSWEEVLRENLEKEGVSAPEPVKLPDDAQPAPVAEALEPAAGKRDQSAKLTINSQEEFLRVIDDIKKMADDPEKLVESHLGVFIEPVPAGKWINSTG